MPPSVEQIEAERPYLLRFALAQLRDSAAAEDAVQDALLAALEARERFAGKASLRTWLTSILRFKLIDIVRKQHREVATDLSEDLGDSDVDGLFSASGHWQEKVSAWGAPEQSLLAAQFWQVYARCAEAMPRRTALVFAMREVLDMEISEICQNLEISATNCSVMLYRARMSLRECLQLRWLQGENA